MIVFELTMPGVGSWNGQWSGSGRRFIRTRREKDVPEEYWDRSFEYRWPDGWCASISVTKMPSKEASRLAKQSSGFCGYDWMISSIIKRGYISTDHDEKGE